jgi:hypothetical protein
MRFILQMIPHGGDETEPGTLDSQAAAAILSYAETLQKAANTRQRPLDRGRPIAPRTPGREPYIDPRYSWAVTG